MRRRIALTLFISLLAVILLAACGSATQRNPNVKLAPVSGLPPAMQNAPASVRTAYQFAVANPDALANVPCYCGCGAMGHTSNLTCYVKEFQPDGAPVFDDHALGCSICVDIALDVMKLSGEGRAPSAIREEIVAVYSRFGPPNQ